MWRPSACTSSCCCCVKDRYGNFITVLVLVRCVATNFGYLVIVTSNVFYRIFLRVSTAPSGFRPPYLGRFEITLSLTNHTRWALFERVISPSQKPPPDNTHHPNRQWRTKGGGVGGSNPAPKFRS
jgi:hypothetical protein